MTQMRCCELHSRLAEHSLGNGNVQSAELADHMAHCDACRCFVAEREELAKNLRAVRESVGEVPASLDAAVLAAFRRHLIEQEKSGAEEARTFHSAFVWGSPAAAAALVAVALFFAVKKPAMIVAAPPVIRATGNLVAQAVGESAEASHPAKPAAAPRHTPTPRSAIMAASPKQAVRSIPEEFRGLMYCDELSCPGDMELIHVQLPSSAVARAAGWTYGSVVNADVIVGPDGIARGIRFEE